MSKILITGGFGYVGGRLAKFLQAHHTVVVSSRKQPTAEQLERHGQPGFVLHDQLLQKGGFPEGVDVVIHLAALNEREVLLSPSEAIKVNIDQTRMVLEQAIAAGVQQFIFFSTAHIYGSPLQGIIDETTLPVPVHPYAITHRAAEDYVLAAQAQGKILSTVIRLSNSFGAPVDPAVNRWTLLVNDLCRQAITQQKLALASNGCQYRDFVSLEDVQTAIQHIIVRREQAPVTGIYNLGSGISMTVLEMAALIAATYREMLGQPIHVSIPEGATPTNEPGLQFSVEKLQSTGWMVKNDFSKELREMLLFCKRNFTVN